MAKTPAPGSAKSPKWAVPHHYGYAAAVDSMGSISAPLLAATSAALLALVISASDKIRWPGLALLLLAGATLCFVAAVQLTFWAKQFVVTPSELDDWWPDRDDFQESEVEWEQRFHKERHEIWASRARLAYNAGILCFLASLPVMLLPHGSLGRISALRVAAVVVAAIGFILEAAWVTLAHRGFFDRIGSQ